MGIRQEIENKLDLNEGMLIPLSVTILGCVGVLASSIACILDPTSDLAVAFDFVSMAIAGGGITHAICIQRGCCLPKSPDVACNNDPTIVVTAPSPSTIEHVPSPDPTPRPEEIPMLEVPQSSKTFDFKQQGPKCT